MSDNERVEKCLRDVAEAARLLWYDSNLELRDHKPIDQEGAVVCQVCGDWWTSCVVKNLYDALTTLKAAETFNPFALGDDCDADD